MNNCLTYFFHVIAESTQYSHMRDTCSCLTQRKAIRPSGERLTCLAQERWFIYQSCRWYLSNVVHRVITSHFCLSFEHIMITGAR